MAQRMMTKEQYINWLRTRGESGTWKIGDCIAADALIKHEAIVAAEKWAAKHIRHDQAREYFCTIIRCTFGSIETDTMLQSINAYPEWMETFDA